MWRRLTSLLLVMLEPLATRQQATGIRPWRATWGRPHRHKPKAILLQPRYLLSARPRFGRRAIEAAALETYRDCEVRSFVGADGALVFTEAMPLSRAAVEEYISLRPNGSPLAALSTKYGWPAEDSFRSYRASMGALDFTELMPPSAPALGHTVHS